MTVNNHEQIAMDALRVAEESATNNREAYLESEIMCDQLLSDYTRLHDLFNGILARVRMIGEWDKCVYPIREANDDAEYTEPSSDEVEALGRRAISILKEIEDMLGGVVE